MSRAAIRNKRREKTLQQQSFKLTVLRQSVQLLGRHRSLYIVFIALSLFTITTCIVIGPLMNKRIINAIEYADRSLFTDAIGLFIASSVLFWLISPIAAFGSAWVYNQALMQIRQRLADHMLKLPMEYYDGHSGGKLLSHFSNDLDCLESIYAWRLYQTSENFCIGFTGLIMLFVIEWRLAIVATLLGGISIWAAARFSAPIGRLGTLLQQHAEQTTIIFLDLMKGLKTIKWFNYGAVIGLQLAGSTSDEANAQLQISVKQAQMNTIVTIFSGMSSFGILIIGGFMVQQGLVDWGSVVVITMLNYATGDLFSLFPMNVAGMQASLAGVERLTHLLQHPVEQEEEASCRFSGEMPAEQALAAKNLFFQYQANEPILQQVSFVLKKSKLTVLVGPSGAGKSTLVKLLLGLYAPCGGMITISAKDRAMEASIPSLSEWRSRIAYVPQQPMLFSGTIADNIKMGNEHAGMEDIEEAARAADIHAFIASLPLQYETVLTDDGGNLSGGQKQRIAIARALLKQADILLLDELTSALDGETEANIMQTVRRLAADYAVLAVAHRESVIAYADEVIRLTQGGILSKSD